MKLLVLFSLCFTLFAQEKMVKEIYPLYRDGAYLQVIESLEKYRQRSEKLELVYYWLGMSYAKLQQYQNSVAHFKKAILLDDSPKDIYYQYGQSLFGFDDIRSARKAFKKSYQRNYSPDLCLYYMGHIGQRLAEWDKAVRNYQLLIEADGARKDLVQAAYYQMALSKLEKAKVRKGTIFIKIRDDVLPLLELAYDEDKISKLSLDIRRSMIKLRKKYKLPKIIKEKKSLIRFKQGLVWDTNVNLSPGELSNTPPTNRESLIAQSDLMLKLKKRFWKKTRTSFELNTKYDYHFKRDEGSIYQYDRLYFAPAIRNEWRHRMFKRDFSLLFDIEYGQTHQDYNQEKELPFYNRTFAVVVGEKFRIFDTGSTMIKFKRKQYYSYQSSSNFATNNFSLIQFFSLKSGNMFLFIFNYDNNNAVDESNSNTNYYFRGDYMISNFWGPIDLRIGSGFGFLDTEQQMSSRGTEIMLTPTIEFTLAISKQINVALNYQFTRNFSKDDTLYDYTKQEVGLELTASF